MAINAEQHITNTGGGTNSEQQQQPQTHKRFLQIRPGVLLPFLASLFPCLRHRANTAASPLTAPPAPPPAAPSDPPAPAEPPITPPPTQTASTANSNDVLMSVDDFARFIRSVKDLLQGTPLLWNRFLEVIETFVPPPPPASPCHAEG